MPGTSYPTDFSPNDIVYHVGEDFGIRKATVITIEIDAISTETTTVYHIRYFGGQNTTPVTENLYSDLGDARAGSLGGGALEAYQNILEAL